MKIHNEMFIPQFDVSQQIEERIDYLEELKSSIEVKMLKMPEGVISVYKGNSPNSFRYYKRSSEKDKHGEYLGKANIKVRDVLAQKKYYEILLRNIESELSKLRKFETTKMEDSVIQTYSKLNPGIKGLITPVNVDDKAFEEIWMKESYNGLRFEESDKTEFYSEKGERMRSKSEVLIANSLLHYGIPYKYECPLKLANGIIRYPDFTVLNPKTRDIKYWEHLGKMGDIDYIIYN